MKVRCNIFHWMKCCSVKLLFHTFWYSKYTTGINIKYDVVVWALRP